MVGTKPNSPPRWSASRYVSKPGPLGPAIIRFRPFACPLNHKEKVSTNLSQIGPNTYFTFLSPSLLATKKSHLRPKRGNKNTTNSFCLPLEPQREIISHRKNQQPRKSRAARPDSARLGSSLGHGSRRCRTPSTWRRAASLRAPGPAAPAPLRSNPSGENATGTARKGSLSQRAPPVAAKQDRFASLVCERHVSEIASEPSMAHDRLNLALFGHEF